MASARTIRREFFELTLQPKEETFISPPDPSQRNWVVTRALEELADDLEHLDATAKRFVEGSVRQQIGEEWTKSQADYGDSQLVIDSQQVMQEWERPYMEAMAKVATETHGDVLEVGFGMGISASYMLAMGVKSYTVIECNVDVASKFEAWKAKYPDQDVSLVQGRWQDVLDDLGQFDAIFFDTYPLTEVEFADYVIRDVTFAQHFFSEAAAHLRDGGVFTYYSNEIDSMSRRHQRVLLEHFGSVEVSVCRPLSPPNDCNYWWADSMVVIKATK